MEESRPGTAIGLLAKNLINRPCLFHSLLPYTVLLLLQAGAQ